MGDHPEHLMALADEDGRRAVVIANALDDAPPEVRCAGSSWSWRHRLTSAATLSSSTWRLLRPPAAPSQ